MSLEREVSGISSPKKSSNISNYLGAAAFVVTAVTIGYLLVLLGKYLLEKPVPYLDAIPQILFQ